MRVDRWWRMGNFVVMVVKNRCESGELRSVSCERDKRFINRVFMVAETFYMDDDTVAVVNMTW